MFNSHERGSDSGNIKDTSTATCRRTGGQGVSYAERFKEWCGDVQAMPGPEQGAWELGDEADAEIAAKDARIASLERGPNVKERC